MSIPFSQVCHVDSAAQTLCPSPVISQHNDIPIEEVDFTLGMKLDGVDKYKNLSIALPEYSQIQVYIDPKIQPFDEIITFRPFSPFNDRFI